MRKKTNPHQYEGKPSRVYRVYGTTVTVDSFLAAAFESTLDGENPMSVTLEELIKGCENEVLELGLSRVVQRKITQVVLDPLILNRLGFGDKKTRPNLALTF